MSALLYRPSRLPNYSAVNLDRGRWPNFSAPELACMEGPWNARRPCKFCGGEYYHDPDFLDALQSVRRGSAPIYFNSAHRCSGANIRVGSKETSQHRTLAVDITLHNQERFSLLSRSRAVGFTGIGLYKNMLHLDTGKQRSWTAKGANRLWT